MSVPVILASASRPRRNLLVNSGVEPMIRVSHVDEPAALARFAAAQGRAGGVEEIPAADRVEEIPAADRVAVLASAKAHAVEDTYRQVADAARRATGTLVISRPLEDGFGVAGREVSISEALRRHAGLLASGLGPFIIGCDSLFEMDGAVTGKAHDPEVARQRLSAMRGNSGTLWTGHSVIDLSTGREESAVSRAAVHFAADMSDQDIDAYVKSKEPLEVAGCFTLEGLGAPFIEAIEGDPSGIIGLSLPTVRALIARFGVHWSDLWNLVPEDGVKPGVPLDPTKPDPTGKAPADNVHQPGDGWVDCKCGHKHWGTNGASGVLLARRDERSGNVTHVLLQHRAAWSAEGGTWSAPGGATADGESPLEGALRESFEEANVTPRDINVVGAYLESHDDWGYTTVLAFEKPGHVVEPHANDDESTAVEWVPVDKVAGLPLLKAFGRDWPMLSARLQALASDAR